MGKVHPWIPCAICAWVSLICSLGRAQEQGVGWHPTHVPVRFQPSATEPQKAVAHAAVQASMLDDFNDLVPGLQLLDVPDGQLDCAMASYTADPNVLCSHRGS